MSKDNSRLIKTICISGSSAVISYLINFFLTSFISENVGIEAYSFVSIAKTASFICTDHYCGIDDIYCKVYIH